MSERDTRYNTSEKGRARYARYRERHREEIRARERDKRISDPVWAVTKSIRDVARANRRRRERFLESWSG